MELRTTHGTLNLPAFMPDATYGSIKGLDWSDLHSTNTSAVVTTTLHLEQKLGSKYVESLGGLHQLWNWPHPIITDSGGFQVFSLIHANKNKANVITEAGCSFVDYRDGSYHFLSPESSQQIQHNLGSDIRVVLDEPTPIEVTTNSEVEAVARTTRWAKRSKVEFMRLNNLTDADMKNKDLVRPLITAVIQGGNNFELRKQSIDELLEIGFDIYGFGGAPLLKKTTWKDDHLGGSFYRELLTFVAENLPKELPKYALGVGTPDDIIYCIKAGWHLFDTVLPTRNARHGLLYTPVGVGDKDYLHYSTLHIKSERYSKDQTPVDPTCDCLCCKTTSRAYLRYLLRIGEASGQRLASIHNLAFYQRVIKSTSTS